jgi:hypothetical protein
VSAGAGEHLDGWAKLRTRSDALAPTSRHHQLKGSLATIDAATARTTWRRESLLLRWLGRLGGGWSCCISDEALTGNAPVYRAITVLERA